MTGCCLEKSESYHAVEGFWTMEERNPDEKLTMDKCLSASGKLCWALIYVAGLLLLLLNHSGSYSITYERSY